VRHSFAFSSLLSDTLTAFRYFSSVSAKVRAVLRLDVVKLSVRHASHTGSQHSLQPVLQSNESLQNCHN
jgi:hypothetical protein